jgi:hypothetical protein
MTDISWLMARNKNLNEVLRMKGRGLCKCKQVKRSQLVSRVKSHLIDGENICLYIYLCLDCKKYFGLPETTFEKARTLASPALVTTFLEYDIPLSEERRGLDSL